MKLKDLWRRFVDHMMSPVVEIDIKYVPRETFYENINKCTQSDTCEACEFWLVSCYGSDPH